MNVPTNNAIEEGASKHPEVPKSERLRERNLTEIMLDDLHGQSAALHPELYPSPEPSPESDERHSVNKSNQRQRNKTNSLRRSLSAKSEGEEIGSHSVKENFQEPALFPSLRQIAPLVDFEGRRGRGNTATQTAPNKMKETVLKLSPAKIYELTSSPESLPVHPLLPDLKASSSPAPDNLLRLRETWRNSEASDTHLSNGNPNQSHSSDRSGSGIASSTDDGTSQSNSVPSSKRDFEYAPESIALSRTKSTPPLRRRPSSAKTTGSNQNRLPSSSKQLRSIPTPLQLDDARLGPKRTILDGSMPSPMPQSIPMPPLSLPTYLQLELSSNRPSLLYIHRPASSDFPYESSRVKVERLLNFLLLPPQLEQVLWFGALACLDAWLFSFTILPLRFMKALSVLGQCWGRNLVEEIRFVMGFIYNGTGRMWRRRRRSSSLTGHDDPASIREKIPRSPRAKDTLPNSPSSSNPLEKEDANASHAHSESNPKRQRSSFQRHRRSKSVPSTLLPDHKADILKGLLIIISCTILMYFDASRMYHGIRGQAAIKLYVIYNVLEVCDRLFSALGQDVLECLFSKEALERKPDGRSKIFRPFWLFVLALFYNLVHATALFYQVITLNVAVNSYSNALLTLLMSNQFVEIKSTVFKRFEKENLFQLTCADVVERFQLWLMLMIIASRNIIETGGLSFGFSDGGAGSDPGASTLFKGSSILPKSFTMFPDWTGQVMGPFLLVLGSEMLVDWIKHAYITKFNNTKPAIYGRFLDVLAKDYYSNAFADQNLTRRLGLPVIPLSCLFIRASVQTYHMFLATHMPPPLPSPATSLSVDSHATPPTATAALHHIDHMLRRALGRSTFGAGGSTISSPSSSNAWTSDDVIAFATMIIVFLILYLVLLALKLVLGMCLLNFARHRYKGMKERESVSAHAEGRRVGSWGAVEVDEDKRRWIYREDVEGAKKMREREMRAGENEAGEGFGGVSRYSMVGKRIW